MAALKQPTIRVVAIIAEGVPESDTKQLIAYARANNKVRETLQHLDFMSEKAARYWNVKASGDDLVFLSK